MVIDKIENFNMYCTNEVMKKACEFMKTHDFSKDSNGVHKIEGEDFFYVIAEYDTKNLEDGFWESHKKYIDVHYMKKGDEKIYYGNFDDMKILKDYDETGDCYILDGESQGEVIVKEESFALCYPQDVHMPGIKVNNNISIRKVIFKIPM